MHKVLEKNMVQSEATKYIHSHPEYRFPTIDEMYSLDLEEGIYHTSVVKKLKEGEHGFDQDNPDRKYPVAFSVDSFGKSVIGNTSSLFRYKVVVVKKDSKTRSLLIQGMKAYLNNPNEYNRGWFNALSVAYSNEKGSGWDPLFVPHEKAEIISALIEE